MNLNTSNILITGASGGIGSRVCSLLALGGATLVLHGLHAGRVNRLKSTLAGEHCVVTADIKDASGRQLIVDACERIGGIDAWVNLAGVLEFGFFHEQQSEAIENLFQVNVLGPMLLTHQLLPLLMARPEARILHVGATYGGVGYPGFAAYGASKAALRTFCEALRRELAQTNVSVAYIAPRVTATHFNNERVMSLHDALGNDYDSPLLVAAAIIEMLDSEAAERFLGWRERLLVKLNALMPSVVRAALLKQLPIVKKHAHKCMNP